MGSNPTSSAIMLLRRGGRAAEGSRLLSECREKISTEGSNPSLSAIYCSVRNLKGHVGFVLYFF